MVYEEGGLFKFKKMMCLMEQFFLLILIWGAQIVLNLENYFIVTFLLRYARLSINNMRMSVEFIQRCDPIVGRVDTCTTFLIPPLVAAPDFTFNRVVVSLDVFLKDKRLTQVEELSLASSGL
jgi:hypothetical protein